MRRAVDRRSRQLKDVLLDEKLRKEFLKGAPKNDVKVVKAFVAANASNALKTRPKVSYSSIFLAFVIVRCIRNVLVLVSPSTVSTRPGREWEWPTDCVDTLYIRLT